MSKILKNTAGTATNIESFGVEIPASTNYTIEPQDYLLLSKASVISELTTLINAGTIVVNDGVNDLSATAGINFLKYPDTAFNVRFLSETERTNGFTSKTVQEAIEEARTSLAYHVVTGTSTLTRTANTFTTVSGMTVTPIAGTYLAIWSGQTRLSNLNGRGETAIFVGGTQQTHLSHESEIEIALLLGLIGTAIMTEGSSNIIGIVTTDGTQAVDVRYRSIDGETMTITNRTLILLRVA